MIVRSIRRVTNDARHNAFTGCCWFKGNLYLAYRQGDAHACEVGRIVVLRSRDGGVSWDHVAVLRGPGDTRDAHLYSDGNCLYTVAFCYVRGTGARPYQSGCASTADGDIWTKWVPYEGTGSFVMWRPQFHRGKHYCAGYCWEAAGGRKKKREVHWFESKDGLRWRRVRKIFGGPDEPNECYLDIRPDGRATMLMRCERRGRNPYLCTSRHPFETWKKQRLADISVGGPCCWTVGDDVYISARWRVADEGRHFAHTAVFKTVKGGCQLQCVLPSGPGFDHSYMGAARHPENSHRFALSFYSDGVAPCDPNVSQWNHPDIYLADVLFEAEYLRDGFLVSRRLSLEDGLRAASCPDLTDRSLGFRKMKAGTQAGAPEFLDVSEVIEAQPGIVYMVRDIEIVSGDKVRVHLGYDGPVKVWWNGEPVFAGSGTNPAIQDQTSLALRARDGANRLAIALDTNGGKAEGVFVRWERG